MEGSGSRSPKPIVEKVVKVLTEEGEKRSTFRIFRFDFGNFLPH